MIYVAAPYTHDDPILVDARYQKTAAYVAHLLDNKQWAYSPIVHCHHIARDYELPIDAQYWQEYNWHMLSKADALHVVLLDGWKQSKGVYQECKFWRACKHEPIVTTVDAPTRLKYAYDADRFMRMMEVTR